MNIQEITEGDQITIDCERLSGLVCDVVDTSVEDIGITKVVAVALTADSEPYAIEWAIHSDTAALVSLDGDWETEIQITDIEEA